MKNEVRNMRGEVIVVIIIALVIMLNLLWLYNQGVKARVAIEAEKYPPNSRYVAELQGAENPVEFLVRGGGEGERSKQILQAIYNTITSQGLPHVQTTLGSLDTGAKAIFIDCYYEFQKFVFTVALYQYGQKDVVLSWWRHDEWRRYLRHANTYTSNFWITEAVAKGYIIFSPITVPLYFVYRAAFLAGFGDYHNLEFDKLSGGRQFWGFLAGGVAENELTPLKVIIEVAIREAVDELGLGADALVPLTTGAASAPGGRVDLY
jgi:hypothetical protein